MSEGPWPEGRPCMVREAVVTGGPQVNKFEKVQAVVTL